MIAFWTIVILAALGLIYIWIRLIRIIFPYKSLEIESNPYTKSTKPKKEERSPKRSFLIKAIRAFYS